MIPPGGLPTSQSWGPGSDPSNKLQTRPEVIDRTDLHIHELTLESDCADNVLRKISWVLRRSLRPGYPENPARRQSRYHRRKSRAKVVMRKGKKDSQVELAQTVNLVRRLRQRSEERAQVIGRIDKGEALAASEAKLLNERSV